MLAAAKDVRDHIPRDAVNEGAEVVDAVITGANHDEGARERFLRDVLRGVRVPEGAQRHEPETGPVGRERIRIRLGEPALRIRKRKSRAMERLRQIFLRGEGHDSAAPSTERESELPPSDEDVSK